MVVLAPPWTGSDEVERELSRRGAAGAVYLIADGDLYHRLRTVRGSTRYALPEGVEDPANQGRLPALVAGPRAIHALGIDLGKSASGSVPSPGPLDRRLDVSLPYETRPRTGFNVAGAVRGTDPDLRDEWLLYVAHYDHVGFGEPVEGDSIWNGFIDNAAGSAILLEIARLMASEPPRRSVAFLFVTAEEQGLLGSNWFVHRAPIPLDRIAAVVNVDGGAPPAPPTRWGLVGADLSEAGRVARRVIESRGWTVDGRPVGPQSDHWPFHRTGVPALLLFPGLSLEGLSREQADSLRATWLRPHTAKDEWSPDFPMAGLGRYAELALEIGRALAGRPRDGR